MGLSILLLITAPVITVIYLISIGCNSSIELYYHSNVKKLEGGEMLIFFAVFTWKLEQMMFYFPKSLKNANILKDFLLT